MHLSPHVPYKQTQFRAVEDTPVSKYGIVPEFRGESIVAEGDDGIDSGGAAGGEDAGG
jgi:hypothetical protein